MKLGMICAAESEWKPLYQTMSDRKMSQIGGIGFCRGSLEGMDVVLVQSGRGKVRTAVATTLLIHQFAPQYVLSPGMAGGFHKDIEQGDIVIATEVRHFDGEAEPECEYGRTPGEEVSYQAAPQLVRVAVTEAEKASECHVMEGLIASGDASLDDSERIASVTSALPALLAADKSAATIGQVCTQFSVPFVVMRAVTDLAGYGRQQISENVIHTAAVRVSGIVKAMACRLS